MQQCRSDNAKARRHFAALHVLGQPRIASWYFLKYGEESMQYLKLLNTEFSHTPDNIFEVVRKWYYKIKSDFFCYAKSCLYVHLINVLWRTLEVLLTDVKASFFFFFPHSPTTVAVLKSLLEPFEFHLLHNYLAPLCKQFWGNSNLYEHHFVLILQIQWFFINHISKSINNKWEFSFLLSFFFFLCFLSSLSLFLPLLPMQREAIGYKMQTLIPRPIR